jgi:hypothetical protein
MTRAWTFAAARVLLACGLLAAGCGGRPPAIVPAEGVVTVNGKPLANAEVEFVPMAKGLGAQYIATAITDEQGRYSLRCNGREGACACENRVVVRDPPTPEAGRGQSAEAQKEAARFKYSLKNRPIPEKYTSLVTTPLTVTPAPGRKENDLKLQREGR